MTEKIGNITLDYKFYQGEDLYSDGGIEDELLSIVKDNPPSEFGRIIEERSSWPILYHLSPLRENIIEWLPLDSTMKVLEVGSGCGAITGALARKAGEVTCIDLSKKRSYINAYRHKEQDNVTIHVGNFKDIETELPCDYDYIFVIGVFEYGQGYMGTANPYEDFMAILNKHLKENGRMAIAIENKFGLKYWAGCREDHLGTYFSGIEGYPQGGGIRTFTRNGLEEIMKKNGINEYSFYYPYPDYKFMTTVFSDEHLPKVGELSNNFRNFDRNRLLLFDEKNAFDNIIKENLFPLYSNSYLLLIGKTIDTKYVKYSNDRAGEFAIRTDIVKTAQGESYVEKYPISVEAKKHIESIYDAYEKLTSRYEGSELQWNTCEKTAEGLRFEFLKGRTLEELMDDCLYAKDYDKIRSLFYEYRKKTEFHSEVPVADYDLIFQNIMIDQGVWTVIDYEWTFSRPIPAKEISARAVLCYANDIEHRKEIKELLLSKVMHLSLEEMKHVEEDDALFHKYVSGQRLPMGQIRNNIGYGIFSPYVLEEVHTVQVYEDKGNGFSEEQSHFIQNSEITFQKVVFTEMVNDDVLRLRVDPSLQGGVAVVHEFSWNGEDILYKKDICKCSGTVIKGYGIVFDGDDPNIVINISKLTCSPGNILKVSMDMTPLPTPMLDKMQKGFSLKRLL